jgi:hypothetical protein
MAFNVVAVAHYLVDGVYGNIDMPLSNIDSHTCRIGHGLHLPLLVDASCETQVTVRDPKTGTAPRAIYSAPGLIPMLRHRLRGSARFSKRTSVLYCAGYVRTYKL